VNGPMNDETESLGLICDRVSHVFENRRGAIEALDGITLRARPHEFICVVGPSGCGKSTLLKIVAGLLTPTSGRVGASNSETGHRPVQTAESGGGPAMRSSSRSMACSPG
jgi:ABC-type nitrate/sulfonate/bicarbonate transport system ATPase subunit